MSGTAPCLLPIASNLARRGGHGIRRYISVRAHQESSDLQRSSRRRVRKSPNTDKEWISVIGLEVHAQIATNTKLFSGAVNDPRSTHKYSLRFLPRVIFFRNNHVKIFCPSEVTLER